MHSTILGYDASLFIATCIFGGLALALIFLPIFGRTKLAAGSIDAEADIRELVASLRSQLAAAEARIVELEKWDGWKERADAAEAQLATAKKALEEADMHFAARSGE